MRSHAPWGAAVVVAALAAAGCDYPRAALIDAEVAPVSDAGDDASPDAAPQVAGDAAVDAVLAVDATTCVEGARRCEGNGVIECRDGQWRAGEACESYCDRGACVTPPSCSGGVATCGPGATDTCCRSLPVPGGTFSRSYDAVSPGFTDPRFRATLSDFHLDRYEVTAARLQAFVASYPADQPASGAGRNPHDAADTGWLPEWTAQLPATQAALISDLSCAGHTQVATAAVRCVSWLVAQAFCIWDGGRLPSEAEWNYAAAGGEEQRVYPWSAPPASTSITSANAIFASAPLDRPGTRSPAGDGRWGHSDLAGNAWEWVADYYLSPYPTTSCDDCASHTVAQFRVNRGGSFANAASAVITSIRGASSQDLPDPTIGFRCARNPAP